MEHGLADLGIIPRYFGEIRHLDVKEYQPHLRKFIDDVNPPSAVFLEYIPNMEMIVWENYTPERGEAMIRGIDYIHNALVLHGDGYPRNIVVFKDDPERVLWLDFDRAETYDVASITEEQRERMRAERRGVMDIAELLVSSRIS